MEKVKQIPGIFKMIVFLAAIAAILVPPDTGLSAGGPSYAHLWGGFSTCLRGRSAEQRGNAARAALDLDNILIAPGARFSFNEHVGARDDGKGYTPAPAIGANGDLSDVPGGGICQLATSIYNAALDAGMEVIERHPHSRAVGYVPPGRDATIATWRKDLKLRNPHLHPLLLRIRVHGERLTVGFWSVTPKPFRVRICSDIIPLEPETVASPAPAVARAALPGGRPGYSAITRRIISGEGPDRVEILSRDTYPAPTRVVE